MLPQMDQHLLHSPEQAHGASTTLSAATYSLILDQGCPNHPRAGSKGYSVQSIRPHSYGKRTMVHYKANKASISLSIFQREKKILLKIIGKKEKCKHDGSCGDVIW